jgi:hypothetical protein
MKDVLGDAGKHRWFDQTTQMRSGFIDASGGVRTVQEASVPEQSG